MTTLPFFILGSLSLLLLNWLTWKGLKNYLQPKGKTAATALEQQLTEQAFAWRTLIGLLWLVPVWPAIAAVMLWYRLRLRKQILSQSRTCPKCGKETLREMSAQEIKKDARLFTPQERLELNLQPDYIQLYTCTACGEKVKVRIPLATGLYEYCPDCHGITLHRKEAYTVVESPTEFSEGLKEARHECKYCCAKYIVGHKIHRTHTSSSHNSFDF